VGGVAPLATESIKLTLLLCSISSCGGSYFGRFIQIFKSVQDKVAESRLSWKYGGISIVKAFNEW
jgi:hypothetical protein